MSGETDRLAAAMPESVAEVCRRLTGAGFEACAVGGAVRDVLLDRPVGDWDVATNASPEEVTNLFRRTIPTGVRHGTVTVLSGRGPDRLGIEVTTYRGEGAYSDGRHPDSVVFGVSLEEDLARRDFVMNAIAYEPARCELHDPFGGVEDLARRRIRAVGDPRARFAEDGLRVMRAVRFAAVLEFDLDPATEAAIPGSLGSLAQVSRERVRDELGKLLRARQPSRGLRIAARTGIMAAILPELTVTDEVLTRVDATADADLRLTALLADLARGAVDGISSRLRLSNAERQQLLALVDLCPEAAEELGDVDARRLLGRLGRKHARALVALWRAGAGRKENASALERALDSGAAVTTGELGVDGEDVMRVLGLPAGPLVGKVLRGLLERVLEDPDLNQRERLEALMPVVRAELE